MVFSCTYNTYEINMNELVNDHAENESGLSEKIQSVEVANIEDFTCDKEDYIEHIDSPIKGSDALNVENEADAKDKLNPPIVGMSFETSDEAYIFL